MRLQAELAAVVLGFVALNLLLVFAAIGLFTRMGPAIERILLRNDATIVAAEEVMEILARTPGPRLSETEQAQVVFAIDRVRNNITEFGEALIIQEIGDKVDATLSGNADARVALIADLRSLIEINRVAMRDADKEAQRLGNAGAWVAACAGLTALGLSLFLSRRLGMRVVRPIMELRRVLIAAQAGDKFRRCSVFQAPTELREALLGLNRILDARSPSTGEDPNVEANIKN